jgi:hypothetical protein
MTQPELEIFEEKAKTFIEEAVSEFGFNWVLAIASDAREDLREMERQRSLTTVIRLTSGKDWDEIHRRNSDF